MDDAIRESSVSMAGENVGEACSFSCARGVCCCSAAMRARAAWRSASDGASISRVLLGMFLCMGRRKDVHGRDSWKAAADMVSILEIDKMQCLTGVAAKGEIWTKVWEIFSLVALWWVSNQATSYFARTSG